MSVCKDTMSKILGLIKMSTQRHLSESIIQSLKRWSRYRYTNVERHPWNMVIFFAAHAVEYVECAAIYIFKMKNTYAHIYMNSSRMIHKF